MIDNISHGKKYAAMFCCTVEGDIKIWGIVIVLDDDIDVI